MRIISWNIRRNSRAVEFAFDHLPADLVLAQEAKWLDLPGVACIGTNIDERWVKHPWGNYTFSRTPSSIFEFPTEYSGSLHLASVESQFGRLGLVNIYGLFEKIAEDSKKKLATAGVHRKLSDLSPILWNRLDHDFDHFVLAGDLNHDRRMDTHKSFRRQGTEVFSGLFERIEDFGMVDLLHRDFPDGVQTYRSVRGNFPWQLDHVFVSKSLASRCTVEVLDNSAVRELSDHNPILIELT